ncbi:MAG: antibiotic biosynthesis monooxygenase [Pseudomonadota bacterium]|nr:antibiotic biosynthesis monooxygenase [Pseudomonadota bacterium]
MILEIADILIVAGKETEFEQAITRGVKEVISKATGFCSYRVDKGVESPQRYVLQIQWATLENHTVDFRESPAFAQWRALVGPYFAKAPTVEHFTLLCESA